MLQAIHRQGYRAPNIRRVYIPKPGKTEKRPLGVPTVTDRALQRSTAEVLSAIYEHGDHGRERVPIVRVARRRQTAAQRPSCSGNPWRGDAVNAVLAAAGYNFRRLLAWLARLLACLAALIAAYTQRLLRSAANGTTRPSALA
jgi:hypothetical protein